MDVYYVRVGRSKLPRVRVGDTIYDVHNAARIFAGLRVALDKAMLDSANGKCLRCGALASDVGCSLELWLCPMCEGVYEPVYANPPTGGST